MAVDKPQDWMIQAIVDDEDIAKAAKELALESIEISRKLLRLGNPTVQATVLRNMNYVIAKGLAVSSVDNEIEELKREMRAMHEEMYAKSTEDDPDDD